jgi:hypothetical protein
MQVLPTSGPKDLACGTATEGKQYRGRQWQILADANYHLGRKDVHEIEV